MAFCKASDSCKTEAFTKKSFKISIIRLPIKGTRATFTNN